MRRAFDGLRGGGSCRRLLREEFKSGRLQAAPSKAAALEQLCERLKFEPDAATAINKALFTERMETFLEDAKITGARSSTDGRRGSQAA